MNQGQQHKTVPQESNTAGVQKDDVPLPYCDGNAEDGVKEEEDKYPILQEEFSLREAFERAYFMIERVEESSPTAVSFSTELAAIQVENYRLKGERSALEGMLEKAMELINEDRGIAAPLNNKQYLRGSVVAATAAAAAAVGSRTSSSLKALAVGVVVSGGGEESDGGGTEWE
jgi:hypothetical protein